MSEPEVIFARCQELLGATGPLAGKRVVVSAGGTRSRSTSCATWATVPPGAWASPWPPRRANGAAT